MHPETLQHLGGCAKSDGLALLLDCQCRQEDWNQAVLAERNTELRVAGDLKQESSVSSFIEQLTFGESANRQSAENKRSRTKAEILTSLFALDPDYCNTASTFEFLFGDEEVGVFELNYLGSGRHAR